MSDKLNRSRMGISLMEVLISVGVVSIGLLGVVSLIPVASQQAEQGTRNDRRANVGRRSFREFNVRDLANAGTAVPMRRRWIEYSSYTAPNLSKRVFNGVLSASVFQPQPFCIDPRYVAAQQDPMLTGAGRYYFDKPMSEYKFLLGRTMGPTDPRIPILSLASDVVALPFMGAEQAEEVFVFQDDLVFESPESNADSPTQVFLNASSKRYAKGQFSWFMTVTPISGDWWKLSTAVCFQRNNLESKEPTRNGPPTVVYGLIDANYAPTSISSGFYTQGVEGGDVRIDWSGATAPREPRSRDWLLLGVYDDKGTAVLDDDDQRFEWYRVLSGSKPDPSDLQDIGLRGVNWDVDFDDDGTPDVPTTVIWFPEVVSVYTKSVQIRNE